MNNAMIGLLRDNNEIGNPFQLLDKMSFYGVLTDSLTYNIIFQCLIKNKKVKEPGKFFVEMTEHTLIGVDDLKRVVYGLLKLGKGPLAYQIFLKAKGARLPKVIDVFLPSCPCYPETFPATLSNIIFSTILSTTKDMSLMFGDDLVYSNRVVQWTEWQIELFVRLENAPSSETFSASHAASVCVQASLKHCSALESQVGLKLSKVPLVLLQPYVEEVLELDFRRSRKLVFDFSENDEILPVSPRLASPLSTVTSLIYVWKYLFNSSISVIYGNDRNLIPVLAGSVP